MCQIIINCSGEESGIFTDTPSSPTDFSVLPGGVIPSGNKMYFATRDQNSIWTISKSDTEWKIIYKNKLV